MTPAPRILVVDDTPANVRLLEAVLHPRGYEVLTAGSGPEALEAVTRDSPDLVLLAATSAPHPSRAATRCRRSM
jgi:CheY-like chemotaxis protein